MRGRVPRYQTIVDDRGQDSENASSKDRRSISRPAIVLVLAKVQKSLGLRFTRTYFSFRKGQWKKSKTNDTTR